MHRYKWTYRFHNLIAHPLLILWLSVGEKLHDIWDFELGPLAAPHNLCKNCGHLRSEHNYCATMDSSDYGYVKMNGVSACGACCSCIGFDVYLTWNVKLSRLWWRNYE